MNLGLQRCCVGLNSYEISNLTQNQSVFVVYYLRINSDIKIRKEAYLRCSTFIFSHKNGVIGRNLFEGNRFCGWYTINTSLAFDCLHRYHGTVISKSTTTFPDSHFIGKYPCKFLCILYTTSNKFHHFLIYLKFYTWLVYKI